MSTSLNMTAGLDDRPHFLSLLERLAVPVLMAAAARSWRRSIPIPLVYEGPSYFGLAEAVTRLRAGISP